MMQIKSLIIISSLLLLQSCKDKVKAKFEVTNSSEKSIDSISVKASNDNSNIEYFTLHPGESKIYWLDMSDLKVDGNYQLSYKKDSDNFKEKSFGYFSNGLSLEETIKIEIRKDTLTIESIYKEY